MLNNTNNKIDLFDIIFTLSINIFYLVLISFWIKFFTLGKEGNLFYILLYLICIIQIIISLIVQVIYNVKSGNINTRKWYKRKTKNFIYSNIWFTVVLFPFIFDPLSIIAIISFIFFVWLYRNKLMKLMHKSIPSCGKYINHLIWISGNKLK